MLPYAHAARVAFRAGLTAVAAAVLLPDHAAAQRLLVRDLLPVAAEVGPPASELFDDQFMRAQLRHSRVVAARIETRFALRQLFEQRGIEYPAAEIFLRVFKRDRVIELWARGSSSAPFSLLRNYEICALAGEPGPKRRQGDNQTPEGFYQIDRFNPFSAYHLSLYIDYPNRSDRILGHQRALGGDIFIHGGCLSIGCIAVTDEHIKEIYWLAVEARAAGQRRIPVHIFPFRMTEAELATAERVFDDRPELVRFWRSLQPAYAHFEQTRQLPDVVVRSNGLYALAGTPDDVPADDDAPAGIRLLGRPVGESGGSDPRNP
jgi:murein L,D-transpeptidase YafK